MCLSVQVVALEGLLQLGAIKTGLVGPGEGTRLAQGRRLRLQMSQQLPMQVDGE